MIFQFGGMSCWIATFLPGYPGRTIPLSVTTVVFRTDVRFYVSVMRLRCIRDLATLGPAAVFARMNHVVTIFALTVYAPVAPAVVAASVTQPLARSQRWIVTAVPAAATPESLTSDP